MALTGSPHRQLASPLATGIGATAVAAVLLAYAWHTYREGVVAQVDAVQQAIARRDQQACAELEAQLAAAAAGARDAVVQQVLASPDDAQQLAALQLRLASAWPIAEVAFEASASPDRTAGPSRRYRWPVVVAAPERGEVVVTVAGDVVEGMRSRQRQRAAEVVAAIEGVAAETFVRQFGGIVLGGLVLIGLAVWSCSRARQWRPQGAVLAVPEARPAAGPHTDFLAKISHELRTPLNAVLGASELLRATELDPEQAELVSTSDLSGRQLLSLVDGLLDLTESEAGRLQVVARVFDIELELEGALQMFAEAAQAKGVAIDLEIDPGFPDVVVGDAARCREVLVALLSNAVRFTSRGAVRIVAHLVQAGEGLRVEVVDSGPGIPPEMLERVFQRSARGSHDGRAAAAGAGFGLSVARALVQRLGGRIGVQSELGVGSTFWFELPHRRPTDLERQEFSASLPLRGRRVLLLTGIEELAVRVTGQLLSQGCEVSLFSPARAGDLAKAPDFGWDCVVIDADVATRFGGGWRRRLPPTVTLGSRRESRGGELVRLPVHKGELLQAVLRACNCRGHEVAPERQRARVLVADDNVVNRRLVEKMLEVAGCSVVLATDGADAVRVWQDGAFDLVLMDYQMPGLDGPGATQRIRALPGGAAVPIVAFTANTSSDVREACSAAGMDGFLTKPLRLSDLEQLLAHWVPRPDSGDRAAAAGAVPQP